MKLIFAIDANWNIGVDGGMLFHLADDLKRFKKITMGNILFMGRKTLEALPNSKPLDGRTHIVLTRNEDYANPPALIVHSLDEAYRLIDVLNAHGEKEVFCIGGGQVISQVLDKCDYAYITKVNKVYEYFDTSIPNLDEDETWEIVQESETMVDKDLGLEYKYIDYQRVR